MHFKTTLFYQFVFCVVLNAQHNTKEKLAEVGFLVGRWNVEVEARLSQQGPWETSKASSFIKLILDSALLEEEFTGTREGKPFLSKTFFAVNTQTNRFQRVFIDGSHGVLVDFEGVREKDKVIFDK